MKKNVGSIDRIIRMLLAAILILLFVFDVVTGTLGYIFLALAAIFVITSLLNWCPIWAIFGVGTVKEKKE